MPTTLDSTSSSSQPTKIKPLPLKYQPLVTALKKKSRESFTHSRRVAVLAKGLGQQLGLTTVELHYLQIGAELHDIGKIQIPEHILNCDHSLPNDAMNVMRTHSTIGVEMVSSLRLDSRITDAIKLHHERWNGAGYPLGLRGEDIPLAVRIITIVDAFDTMISKRIYQPYPRRMKEAIIEIERCAGTQFDPALAARFLRQIHARHRRTL